MIKFSIVIPIYKESPYTLRLLKSLEKRKDIEVIIEIDEPEEDYINKLLEVLKDFRFKLRAFKVRRGKVRALNDAIEIAEGKYIIFLDSDVYKIDVDFDKLERVLERVHIVPFLQKHENKTLVQKIMSSEAIILNTYYIVAKKLNSKALLLNGAGFAVRREVLRHVRFKRVMAEDMYFSAEVFLKGYTYDVIPSFKIYVAQVKNLKQLIDQRIRWGINAYELINLDIYRKLFIYEPKMILLGILYLPSILVTSLILLLLNFSVHYANRNLFFLPAISIKGSTFVTLLIFQVLLIIFVLLLSIKVLKNNKLSLDMLAHITYLLFVQPAILLLYLGVVLWKALTKGEPKLNWKV